MKIQTALIVSSLTLLAYNSANADVKPMALFGDHMVLQQGISIPVWGTADAGEQVTVTFEDQKKTTKADADGKWMVRLKDLKPGTLGIMTIAGKNTITIHDVLVGEVWLASGQSNMDFTVAKTTKKYFAGTQNEAEEIAAANYPAIRMFTVDLKLIDTPQTDVTGHWDVCSPQTVGDMSAVAYFFARDLYQDKKLPVGIIDSTWGASTAQCWTSQDALVANPKLKFLVDDYETTCNDYASGATKTKYAEMLQQWTDASTAAQTAGKPAPRKPKEPGDPHQDQHNPFLLYNGMIAPVKPYAIRGAIWYQGESNGPTADLYFDIMKTMIGDWRHAWGQGDFPFLSVQIANINALATVPVSERSTPAKIRYAQLQTLNLPNTGLAVTIDIGDPKNIHPKDKQDVGHRLALAAQALVYHKNVPYSGPIYDSMRIEGNQVRLKFKHTDGGLMAKGDTLTGFGIAGEDKKFVWADAKIDGDTIVVSSSDVAKPVAASYGWADNPPVNLYNKAGLPASPFRTDVK